MNKIILTIILTIAFLKIDSQTNRFDNSNNSSNQANHNDNISLNEIPSEIDFYDSNGNAKIYFALSNAVFYNWEGLPVGFLDKDAVYTYSGKKIGWFDSKGLLKDNNGYIVGFLKGSLNIPLNPKEPKSPKHPALIATPTSHPGYNPKVIMTWSQISLTDFFDN